MTVVTVTEVTVTVVTVTGVTVTVVVVTVVRVTVVTVVTCWQSHRQTEVSSLALQGGEGPGRS